MKHLLTICLIALGFVSSAVAQSTENAKSLSDGLHIGGKTTDRVGFHNATPSAQTAATASTRAVIQGKGLQAADGTITATATAGAATLNTPVGSVTSEALTTAAAATYTLTVTNSTIAATSIISATVANGTNSAGAPCLITTTPAAGSVVFVIKNVHAADALNGTIKVNYALQK